MEKKAGKLKIGDDWNAISIIALSQNSPLKAIAEFVENAIDAEAKSVTIVRGKHLGDQYLKIIDDGHGISDFHYVTSHIGDSIKRKLKKQGATGLQGEFGIGLLSFWTVGDRCVISSRGVDGITRRLTLVKGNPSYALDESGELFDRPGTELNIYPLLPGVRVLSGDKIQNYLASELRDRIVRSGVRIKIVDRTSRRELLVEPRKFRGRLLHALPQPLCPAGDMYVELYLADPSGDPSIALSKHGTRVLPDITKLEEFSRFPWNSRYLEGIVDASFLQLTPGTRDGVILDERYESFVAAMESVGAALEGIINEQRKAEEEEASKAILHKVTRALKEAFMLLPNEEYGWLAAQSKIPKPGAGGEPGGPKSGSGTPGSDDPGSAALSSEMADGSASVLEGEAVSEPREDAQRQKQFFEYSGPLHSLTLSPSSSVIGVGEKKKLRAIARDKQRKTVEGDLRILWTIKEGAGELAVNEGEFCEYVAPGEPGLCVVEAVATQGEIERGAESIITIVAELVPRPDRTGLASKRGLPGYTFKRAPGELWRSRYEIERGLIVVNNGHADFIYASRGAGTKLRYIARLYAKELVLANFPEASREELLERMAELMLYTEENLK